MKKRLNEKEIFKTKFFTIKDIDLKLSNGKVNKYQIIEKRDTSLIVPITLDGKLIYVEEFFAAINEYQVGLPKGRIDEGLDALTTANKELQEEIGYKANKLTKLGILTISPGYLTQKTHVYLAEDLVESKLPADDDEEIKVMRIPLSQFENLIEAGKLTEARMISALYIAKKYLKL